MRKALFILSLILFISCSKEEMRVLYSNQETKINSYIDSQISSNPDYYVTFNKGAARLTVCEGSGSELTKKGTAEVYLAVYNFSSYTINKNTLAYTNKVEIAAEASLDTSDESAFETIRIRPSEDGLLEGLANGLPGVKAGEECYIIFSGQYGLEKNHVGTIPANAPLAFHIWVMDITND